MPYLQEHDNGHVLRVGKALSAELAPGVNLRADTAAAKIYLARQRGRQIRGVVAGLVEHWEAVG